MAAPSTTMDNKQPTEPSPAQQSISSPEERTLSTQTQSHKSTHTHTLTITQNHTHTYTPKKIFNTAVYREGKNTDKK